MSDMDKPKESLDTLDDEKVLELTEGDVAAEDKLASMEEIEITVKYASNLEEGKIKNLLDRIADETKEYPHVKVKIDIT